MTDYILIYSRIQTEYEHISPTVLMVEDVIHENFDYVLNEFREDGLIWAILIKKGNGQIVKEYRSDI